MTAEIEKGIEATVILANQIFTNLRNSMLESVSLEQQYEWIVDKFPEFSKEHPIVLKKMVFNRCYYESALRNYLDKRYMKYPPQSMEDFNDRQADYARFLYIENCKFNKVKWNPSKAKKIWEYESNNLHRIVKKLKEEEKDARSEYERESKRHFEEKKLELLEYLRTIDGDLSSDDFSEFDDSDEVDINFDDEIPDLIEPDLSNGSIPIESSLDKLDKLVDEAPAEAPAEAPTKVPAEAKKFKKTDGFSEWIDPSTKAFFKKKQNNLRGTRISKKRR